MKKLLSQNFCDKKGAVKFCNFHTVAYISQSSQCGNYRNFVKATVLPKNLLKRWFHEIFFRWEREGNFRFSTLCKTVDITYNLRKSSDSEIFILCKRTTLHIAHYNNSGILLPPFQFSLSDQVVSWFHKKIVLKRDMHISLPFTVSIFSQINLKLFSKNSQFDEIFCDKTMALEFFIRL